MSDCEYEFRIIEPRDFNGTLLKLNDRNRHIINELGELRSSNFT